MSLHSETLEIVLSFKSQEQTVFMTACAERLLPLLLWLNDADQIHFAEQFLEVVWKETTNNLSVLKSSQWDVLAQNLNKYLNQPVSDLIPDVLAERYIYILKYVHQHIDEQNTDETVQNMLNIISDTLSEIDHYLSFYKGENSAYKLPIHKWGNVGAREISHQWNTISILLQTDLTLKQKAQLCKKESSEARDFLTSQLIKLQARQG